jgi:tetratricopeptide (TPR) repeat protein
MTYLALLARLFYDPPGAISALRADRPVVPSLVSATIATVVYFALLSGLLQDLFGIARVGGFDAGGAGILGSYLRGLPRYAVPVIVLCVFYVPSALFLTGAFTRGAGPIETLRREYATTLATALAAWTATLALWALPAALLADPFDRTSLVGWTILPMAFFLIPMTLNLARVEEAGYGRAFAAALLASLSLAFTRIAAGMTYLLSSPIVLVILFFVFRGVLREWSSSRTARARFERGLEASTLNPADASAHLNLALIYRERGDVARAAERFERALAIDPNEIDARYELGRLERERGRYAEAIAHFDPVVQQNEAHSNHEVWREIGATYLAAGQLEDAHAALLRFLERRPSDAEGLYLMGLALDALGRKDEARARMEAVVEAMRTAPTYKFRLDRRWLREAQSYLSRNR